MPKMMWKDSVIEVLDQTLVIQVSPVVHLDFPVEGLDLLLDLILAGCIGELVSGVANVRGV